MSINLVNGDLITMAKEYQFDIIGHFCDCEKGWDSTLSSDIRYYYPLSYNTDTDSFPIDLGEFSVCNDYLFKILNIYLFCVDQDKKRTAYYALDQACFNINRRFHGKKLAISYDQIVELGLNWDKTKKIFIDNFKSLELFVITSQDVSQK